MLVPAPPLCEIFGTVPATLGWALGLVLPLTAQNIPVDLSHYSSASGVQIQRDGDYLSARWHMNDSDFGWLKLDLNGKPLIAGIGIASGAARPPELLLTNIEPVTFLTVGTRRAPPGRPPEMSIWNTFFDKVPERPYQTYRSQLVLNRVRVSSEGRRAQIELSEVAIGPFKGELVFTMYSGSRLLRVEAVVSTTEDERAIIYDAGFLGDAAAEGRMAWMDPGNQFRRVTVDRQTSDQPLAVRHRTIIAENNRGSIACFPPPHQFFFPRDLTDNLKFVWMGRAHRGPAHEFGFGVRQSESGGGAFVPWFNAPPGTQQRLGVFYLLTRGRAEEALAETLRYTRNDHFPKLSDHVTFTSHYHMAITVARMAQEQAGRPLSIPDFVRVFKEMGVSIVHLAEFHGDGHQDDPGPLRLPELEAMFAECRRLSDSDLLLIPGEEINDFLGIKEPGKHPGHWMSLFPKPVLWVMKRTPDQPFATPDSHYGTRYRVGSRADMIELLQREHGLAWSAHPRIKASSWTPDIFRREDFYLADFWLGGAWKAMPADLSRPRLGERCLNLLDDMANWGQKKYLPGEVDVFKIDHTHELFGHMNINYLKLDRLPTFDEGWQPVLDTLRAGKFFTTTGEILISEFSIGGKRSGETLKLKPGNQPELRAKLDWTFPLQFAEIISGDGQQVYREAISLTDTGPFGSRALTARPKLQGRKWVRFEVWDAAVNGAYTQPIWLEPE